MSTTAGQLSLGETRARTRAADLLSLAKPRVVLMILTLLKIWLLTLEEVTESLLMVQHCILKLEIVQLTMPIMGYF